MGDLAGSKIPSLTLAPEAPRTGAPITAIFSVEPKGQVVVKPASGQAMEAFAVTPTRSAAGWAMQFSVTEPGNYVMTTGKESQLFHVEKQITMNFMWEFGVFAGLSVIVVGGIIACVIQKKKKTNYAKEAGSF